MSQDLKPLRGLGNAALLVAVSCLCFSCATAVPPRQRTAATPPASSPPASARTTGTVGSAAGVTASKAVGGKPPAGSPQLAKSSSGVSETQKSIPTVPATPAEHPSPQTPPASELNPVQLSHEVSAFGAAGNWPLTTDGHALILERRPAATVGPDVFAVFAAVEHASEARVSTLSDFSRLFKQNISPLAFSLVEFRENGGRITRVQSFGLGNHLVFETFKIIPIKKGSDEPFAVSVTFQTQEGSDDVWETFSALGNSQIILRQTLSRSPMIEDIDNDGYLDIILRERGIEEGTGYETFLTWYKWNGRSFVEYRTTNIVRNLRQFLDRAATLLSQDQVREFLQTSLPHSELAKLRSEGKSETTIFDDVFHLLPSSPDNPNNTVGTLNTINQVIFPNIFENPFTEQSRNGYRFPMTVRFVTSDGASHFYSAKIYMHRNPFVPPQFTFAVGSSNDPN